jgi:hypothetical protein
MTIAMENGTTNTQWNIKETHGNEAIPEEYHEDFGFTEQSYINPADREKEIGNWVLDEELSDVENAIYHNHTRKKTHISHRGSVDVKNDWIKTDIPMAWGGENNTSRMKRSGDKLLQSHDKFGYTVDSSGHSLGGTIVTNLNEKYGNNEWMGHSTTFNPGVSLTGLANPINKRRMKKKCGGPDNPFCDKITHIKQKNDRVSNKMMMFGGGMFGWKDSHYGKTLVFNNSSSCFGLTGCISRDLDESHRLHNFKMFEHDIQKHKYIANPYIPNFLR